MIRDMWIVREMFKITSALRSCVLVCVCVWGGAVCVWSKIM